MSISELITQLKAQRYLHGANVQVFASSGTSEGLSDVAAVEEWPRAGENDPIVVIVIE